MKIGFWNINRNSNVLDFIYDFAHINNIDLLILLESSLAPATVLAELNIKQPLFYFYSPLVSDFIQIYSRFPTDLISDISDDGRLSAKEYKSPLGSKVNFIFVHGPSKLHYEEGDQDANTSEIRKFIDATEDKTQNMRTVVLGDFNMNPFQKGMVQSTGLHATFDKNVALKETRKIQGKTYKYFYNPMWSFYGELGKGIVNGSYYYSSAKPICYYWNIFDQVLVRPILLRSEFDEPSLNIVTSLGSKKLLSKHGIINKNISDHLPLEFVLNVI